MPRQTMNFLNSKARKEFFKALSEKYGYDGPTDFTIFEGGKDKYYLISRAIEDYLDALRIEMGGLYVAQNVADGIRLSMDGAMHFGPYCTAPRITLTAEQRDHWLKGEEVELGGEDTDWQIVICGADILGCSKVKDGWLLSYIPKNRWILEPHEY